MKKDKCAVIRIVENSRLFLVLKQKRNLVFGLITPNAAVVVNS